MKTGLAQIDISWEDKPQNTQKCEEFIKHASEMGVELIVFPEMTLTGFSMNVNEIGEMYEESLKIFTDMAVKYKISISFGYVRKVGDRGGNIQALVDVSGRVLYEYLKIHPFSFVGENIFYISGNIIEQVEFNGFCITPFICYDLRFPEIFQIASNKTNLFILIANWPKARAEHWKTLLIARAIENQSYIIAVNRVGEGNGIEYAGDSMIVAPDGEILTVASLEETLLIADINVDRVTEVRNNIRIKEDRRVDFYMQKYLTRKETKHAQNRQTCHNNAAAQDIVRNNA